jgi:hypothetical protein
VGEDKNKYVAGWRKVVRLKALPSSKADTIGLATIYILFNVFEPDPNRNPFLNKSANNQVIIIPRNFATGSEDSMYWLVYKPKGDGYKIGYFLFAAFDLPGRQNYYVPTACAQCHGHDQEYGSPSGNGTFSFAKLNYLDTDQWYDAADFDFPETIAGPFDVIFDGGIDHSGSDYKNAVDILRKLNGGILQQNVATSRANQSDLFKIRAVEKWVSLHTANDLPVDTARRALDVGGAVWDPSDPDNQHLLGLLDRFCFRCHSSMYYHVFDKQGVLDEKRQIIRRVGARNMPQGRQLDDATRGDLILYVNKLP